MVKTETPALRRSQSNASMRRASIVDAAAAKDRQIAELQKQLAIFASSTEKYIPNNHTDLSLYGAYGFAPQSGFQEVKKHRLSLRPQSRRESLRPVSDDVGPTIMEHHAEDSEKPIAPNQVSNLILSVHQSAPPVRRPSTIGGISPQQEMPMKQLGMEIKPQDVSVTAPPMPIIEIQEPDEPVMEVILESKPEEEVAKEPEEPVLEVVEETPEPAEPVKNMETKSSALLSELQKTEMEIHRREIQIMALEIEQKKMQQLVVDQRNEMEIIKQEAKSHICYKRGMKHEMESMGMTTHRPSVHVDDSSPAAKSLFEGFMRKTSVAQARAERKNSVVVGRVGNHLKSPQWYTQPFCDFLTENPTVFHTVNHFEGKLTDAGFEKLSERKIWTEQLKQGGKYYVSRNGSSLVAFTVGAGYQSGNGVAMVAGHVDALTAKLKPISNKKTTAGYVQLGVAPYAGALNSTWWDRDLGIGGRVVVKDSTGKISTKLVKLGWPIARIPTLAPHFGVGITGQNNAETEAVPIIGLDNSDSSATEFENLTLGGVGSFTATQPPKLVRAIAGELNIKDVSTIINWELELYDVQPAQTGGLDKEFIFAGRVDDKLCSWAAIEGLLASAAAPSTADDGIVKLVGVFDDEEIGSQLRQGAKGNFLPSVVERIAETFSKTTSSNVLSQTYANSFLISADVTHAVNPNFLGSYLEGHAPRLNTGLVIAADSNGHLTTDAVSSALLTRVAEKSDSKLQVFMIRNDSRSGGTVGPILSSAMGVRSVDAGLPQLSMHSIRATTGSLDPGLGVKVFKGFFDHFEAVDKEFE